MMPVIALAGRLRSAALAAAIAVGGGMSMAGAAELAPPPAKAPAPPAPPSDWHYQATLYGWATGLNGDIGVRHLPPVAVDVPFSQMLQNLDGAVMGSFLADNGQFMILADLVLARLSNSGASGGAQLELGLDQTVATGAVGYMLPTGREDLDVALTAGLRYMRLTSDQTIGPLFGPLWMSASQAQSWVDPTVGFFVHWDLDEKWFLNALADIGGFGVGSKLSSNGYIGLGYSWTQGFSTALGYRYLYEDYEGPGATTGTFRYNATTHGPTLSMAWHF